MEAEKELSAMVAERPLRFYPLPFSVRLATFIRQREQGEGETLSPTADDTRSGLTTWSTD
jgi:hypothetical protein